MKRFGIAAVVGSALLLAVSGVGAGAAQAGPVQKATGSVLLSDPVQYVSFNAFETSPAKGSVNYTNFTYPSSHSGVWVPDSFSMAFAVNPSTTTAATYDMTVTSFTPTSPTSVTFTGTGECVDVPVSCRWISTFTGHINGSSVHIVMREINQDNASETYEMDAFGTISATGLVSGTWYDDYYGTVTPPRGGMFTIADIGHEVLNVVAPVENVVVEPGIATFQFVVPAGLIDPSTVRVYVEVTDGGSSGAGGTDTWKHGTTSGVYTNYPVVAGNLTVHS